MTYQTEARLTLPASPRQAAYLALAGFSARIEAVAPGWIHVTTPPGQQEAARAALTAAGAIGVIAYDDVTLGAEFGPVR